MASCQIAGRPLPYGQAYLGAPQKSSCILPPEGQGERCRKNRCAPHGIGQAVMDIAWGTPHETHPCISGGKADYGRAGKRGGGFWTTLPQYYPAAGHYLRPFAQRSPSEEQTQTAAPGDQRGGRCASPEDSHLL